MFSLLITKKYSLLKLLKNSLENAYSVEQNTFFIVKKTPPPLEFRDVIQ